MRARSRKRDALLCVYYKRRDEFLEANPRCVRCYRTATEVHHAAGRVGLLLIAVEHFRPLCHDCHRWVTEHPLLAKAAGLSVDRLGA